MKAPIAISFTLFLLGVLLFLAQLWAQPFGAELFSKLILTDGALFVVSLVAAFLIREHAETAKPPEKNELD